MPVFYHFPFVLLCGLIFAAILTLIVGLLIHRWKVHLLWKIAIVVNLAYIFLFVGVMLSNKILYPLQASVAVDYIQSSLDKECGKNTVLASHDGFYADDGYHWSSCDQSVSCYFNNVEWICACTP